MDSGRMDQAPSRMDRMTTRALDYTASRHTGQRPAARLLAGCIGGAYSTLIVPTDRAYATARVSVATRRAASGKPGFGPRRHVPEGGLDS